MAKTPIRTFRCEDEYWDALGRIAKERERTQSWLTRLAVREFVERDRAAKRIAKQSATPTARPRDAFDLDEEPSK